MMTSMLELLEETAARFPDKAAFVDARESVDFAGLRERCEAIGSAVAAVTKPRQPVAVYMEKGARSIAAFLGAVYAGGFYVPIDRDMPEERILLIFEQLRPAVVLCDEGTAERAHRIAGGAAVIDYDEAVLTEPDRGHLSRIRAEHRSTDLLYVLFTSGSTGVPKGVTISHAAALDFTEWICEKYQLDETAKLCNQAPFYFDASVPDLFIPLKTGATTYIPPKSHYSFPKKILRYIEDNALNTLIWVPSALCNVVNCRAFEVCVPHSVRLVIFCGEVMPCRHLNEWRRRIPGARYVNMYGPTEATYACMYYEIDRAFADDDKLPLGRACENSGILLLTEDNRQAAAGEIGEICILGVCLSNGYYHQPERTAEVFVQNPLCPDWTERMYRTGDLAHIDARGDVVFDGRKDFQIKRLGHRIELGEIESAILSAQEVRNACCLYDEEKGDIVAVYEGESEPQAIGALLAEKLPRYMAPDRYVRLEKLPLNINGKTDRTALRREYIGR